jgi:hypothetical protein
MSTFDELIVNWEWRPIRNCPGRYILSEGAVYVGPQQLLDTDVGVGSFQVAKARDTVLVARLDKGGLISYRRADGRYLHTLNTEEGFKRKLKELGIEMEKR